MKSLRSLIASLAYSNGRASSVVSVLTYIGSDALFYHFVDGRLLGLAETLAEKVLTLIEVLSAVVEKMSESDLGKTIYFGFTLFRNFVDSPKHSTP
jgi:hypothetical protein